jgi:hypothetical protein
MMRNDRRHGMARMVRRSASVAELADPDGFLRALAGPISWNCFGHNELNDWRRASRSAAMRLHTHRSHPWSIDLVTVTVSALLVVGFACALVALWAH